MTGLCALMTVLFVTLGLASAQTPICHGKPTEKVIRELYPRWSSAPFVESLFSIPKGRPFLLCGDDA
jgi:hypothetical protein